MTGKRILAVTHETTITGAPMNLLHFLRWLHDNTDVEIHTLALQDGPLRERFEPLGEVTVLDRSKLAAGFSIGERGLTHLGLGFAADKAAHLRVKPQLRNLGDFDLIYLNSLASTSVLEHLDPDTSVVSHVHELQVAMRGLHYAGLEVLFRERPARWVACSEAVRDMLVDEAHLNPERVLLHHEFIDATSLASAEVTPSQRAEVEAWRKSAGIPPGARIVMGTGTLEWRKGPHLFVQLAAEVRRHYAEPVHFIWVGGKLEGIDWARIEADCHRANLDNIHFVGVKPHPLPWFEMADVFALTSHEDPYPLVCLEHAAMGHPLVTFRNGGMPELLAAAGPEAALGIHKHLDVGAMADHIMVLLDDDELRQRVGDALREAVFERHDVDASASRLFDDLAEYLT